MPYVGQIILAKSEGEYRDSLRRDALTMQIYNSYLLPEGNTTIQQALSYEQFIDAIVAERELLTDERRSKLGGLDTWASAQSYLAKIAAQKIAANYKLNEENIVTDPQKIDEEINAKSQCLLIENIPELAKYNFGSTYTNLTLIHGSPETIVSKLVGPTLIEPFWSVTPEQFARFQPLARIFKTYYDEENKERFTVEMPFSEHMTEDDLQSITESSVSRGTGVGLENIDWRLQGTNPAESKNVIEVDLKFRFDSLQEIARERIVKTNKGTSEKVSFLDFFVYSRGPEYDCKDGAPDVYNPNNFSFKILVGWNELTNMFEPTRQKEMKSLSKSVKQDQRMMRLTMTNHELDISEEGPVYLTLNAIGSLDAVSFTESSNVFKQFAKDTSVVHIQNALDVVKANLKCADKDNFNKDEWIKFNQQNKDSITALEGQLTNQKTLVWSGFLRTLSETNKMWAVQAPKESFGITKTKDGKLGVFVQDGTRISSFLGPFNYEGQTTFRVPEGTDADKSMGELEGNRLEKQTARLKAIEEGGEEVITIPYMYLGDILDLALNALNEDNNEFLQKGNHKTYLCDMVYHDPYDQKKYSVNLADIPVSFDLFKDWFTEHVFKPQVLFYPVKQFIADFMESVIYEMFKPNRCFIDTPKRRLKISYLGFSVPTFAADPLNPTNRLRLSADEIQENKKKSANAPQNGRDKFYFEYLVIYNSDLAPIKMEADYERDLAQGIPWAYIGRDRGLIKKVKFNRSDLPYVRESRIVQGATEFAKLRERYEATIEMIGNSFFYPGQFLFINPSTLTLGSVTDGAKLATTLGLIGYYQVISVSNTIGVGDFSTTVKALWTSGGYKESALEVKTGGVKPKIDMDKYELEIIAPWSTFTPEELAGMALSSITETAVDTYESAKKLFTPLANMFKVGP